MPQTPQEALKFLIFSIIVGVFTLVIEYWIIQPLRNAQNNRRITSSEQEGKRLEETRESKEPTAKPDEAEEPKPLPPQPTVAHQPKQSKQSGAVPTRVVTEQHSEAQAEKKQKVGLARILYGLFLTALACIVMLILIVVSIVRSTPMVGGMILAFVIGRVIVEKYLSMGVIGGIIGGVIISYLFMRYILVPLYVRMGIFSQSKENIISKLGDLVDKLWEEAKLSFPGLGVFA